MNMNMSTLNSTVFYGTHSMTGHGTDSMTGHGHGTRLMGNDHSRTMGGHNIPGDHSTRGHSVGFEFSSKAIILFHDWSIDSIGGMVWSCIVVFLMAMFYEGFKVFREVLRKKHCTSEDYDVPGNNTNGQLVAGKGFCHAYVHKGRSCYCNRHHFLQSFLHIIQVAISYFLMLIAMTYNGWLFIAVCLGAGFGYFLFSWKFPKSFDVNEHCY
ncbi:high affinity copper uptake protein 1-like [Dendronephthya gigantea]|uniref:high affinity copper uptake protein 1-like n=1 Tax=Dendronephthya gigantea TaxID=151771 RepID=UPI0010691E70|nr:high affinity copper uptake protein 1-like [Dendronephthya gigantea]